VSEKDNHFIELQNGYKLFREKPPRLERLLASMPLTPTYLQVAHVQLLPQLQFSQVQFGLSHFCLSLGVTLLNLISDFITFVLLVFK
jgi:hypothetical protein